MKILITNDDGIDSIGIKALANSICTEHEVVVVAPSSERSACSHSLSSMYSISYDEVKDSGYNCIAYSCSGTPADCVKLAILHLADNKPFDLVLSGINNGTNLGSDVIYSGTVSGAFEGIYMGIPSIAISANHRTNEEKFNEIADFMLFNLGKLLSLNLPKTSALNINYPTKEPIRGVKITPLGVHLYGDGFFPTEKGLRLQGEPLPHDEEDNDIFWFNNGYVAISPIQNDRNDYHTLGRIKGDLK